MRSRAWCLMPDICIPVPSRSGVFYDCHSVALPYSLSQPHRARSSVSLMSEGAWRTPLGDVNIDHELAEQLLQAYPALTDDPKPIALNMPSKLNCRFLQFIRPGADFSCRLRWYQSADPSRTAWRNDRQVIQKCGHQVLIIASSDMNHYEDDSTTRVKDRKAIERILALDPRRPP